MALIPCPECGKSISTSAVACPHCGAPSKTAPQRGTPVEPPKKKTYGCGSLFALGVIAIVVIGVVNTAIDSGKPPPAKSGNAGRRVNVGIEISSMAVRLTNNGSPDWTQAEVYLNGMPPFTFKATATAPPVGQSITIPLVQFVDRDGNRFNPLTKAVTSVWVGGSGYDYAETRVR